jgi:mannitol/fructose-specific phosphotransferase system IIA component (Ntr-type)
MDVLRLESTAIFKCDLTLYDRLSMPDYEGVSKDKKVQAAVRKQRRGTKVRPLLVNPTPGESKYAKDLRLRLSLGYGIEWVDEWSRILIWVLNRIFPDPSVAYMHYVAIVGREAGMGSTGIGRGAAVPHLKTPWTDVSIVTMIRLKGGLAFDFRGLDGDPVDLVTCLLVNHKKPGELLRLLEGVSRFYRNVDGIRELSSEELLTAIQHFI